MNSTHISLLIKRLTTLFEIPYNPFKKKITLTDSRTYDITQLADFVADLIYEGRNYDLTIIENFLDEASFKQFLAQNEHPVIFFERTTTGIVPVIWGKDIKKNANYGYRYQNSQELSHNIDKDFFYLLAENQPELSHNGKVLFLTIFPMESLVSNSLSPDDSKTLKPLQRLLRLLSNEKKDISYIYIYAIVTGLISLTLPLGIQAIIGLISGGLVFSSVYVLVGLVIAGIILTGILQIVQISLVETLQRRVFAKAAYEFTYRIPRIRAEALLKY